MEAFNRIAAAQGYEELHFAPVVFTGLKSGQGQTDREPAVSNLHRSRSSQIKRRISRAGGQEVRQGRRGVWQGAGDIHKKTLRYKGH